MLCSAYGTWGLQWLVADVFEVGSDSGTCFCKEAVATRSCSNCWSKTSLKLTDGKFNNTGWLGSPTGGLTNSDVCAEHCRGWPLCQEGITQSAMSALLEKTT